MTPLFFGCLNDEGHFLYEHYLFEGVIRKLSRVEVRNLGFTLADLDTGYCPHDPAASRPSRLPPAHAHLISTQHGTILSMWDQSGDSRPGSHATFVFPNTAYLPASLEDALARTRLIWPDVIGRIEQAHGPITLLRYPLESTTLQSFLRPCPGDRGDPR